MVSIDRIRAARGRIADAIDRTPCAHSGYFSQETGSRVFFKLENLHVTGSFKERGALNRILTLEAGDRAKGIITASAGNHAQAVAYHASRLGIEATVVMPKQTPLIKVANTRRFGGKVILEGDNFDAAYEHSKALQAKRKLTFVHPFDDPEIVAGQGTVALELLEQQPDLEVLVVPVGGGGLISGIAAAYKALRPQTRIVGVETEEVPSMTRSRAEGAVLTLEPRQTIADGIAVKRPGELTFRLVQEHVDDLVTVTEEEIANAILLLLEREKTVAEGAAAVTLAALINGRIPDVAGRATCLVLSGGNIDVNLLSRIIERGLAKDGRMARLEVKLRDRPGALARMLNLVADAEANVIEVFHQRAFNDVAVGDVDVELTLETRDMKHLKELARRMRKEGYEVRRL